MSSCYFPNGDLAGDNEIPCGSGDGVPCCPLNWECQENGLCYLPTEKWFGRYACTDRTWQSSGCPQICTQDKTAVGAEAILECSPGSYCCDANRPDAEGDVSKACCNTSNDRFSIENRAMVDSAGDAPPSNSNSAPRDSPTPSVSTSTRPSTDDDTGDDTDDDSVTVSGSGSPDSAASVRTERGTTTTSPSTVTTGTATSEPTGTTSIDANNNNAQGSTTSVVVVTSIVTRSDGGSSTLTTSRNSIIAAPISTPTSATPPDSAESTPKALIIGPAVGVPLVLLALAALAFFLWRRRKQKKATASSVNDSPGYKRNSGPVDMYAAHKPHYPELESPEMKTRPSSYESPDHVGVGADPAGAVGLGLGAAPAAYRGGGGAQIPGEATRVKRHSELPGSPAFPPPMGSPGVVNQRPEGGGVGGLHVVNQTPEPEPSELPASTYHAYKPYRPPGAAGG